MKSTPERRSALSASWGCDRAPTGRSRRTGRWIAPAAPRRDRPRLTLALGLALALAALFATGEASARIRNRHAPDSGRVVRKISISDRGIEIVRSSEDPDSLRPGRIRGTLGIGGKDHSIELDVDSLGFSRTTKIVGPGVVVDTDESGMVRMFSDAEVPRGERVEGDVVAIFGDVLIEGSVSGNAVAVFGSVRLAPGASVEGDAVAVGGGLDQPQGATVGGQSVSLGFLPLRWGVPALSFLLGLVLIAWLLSLILGWVLMLIFPTRMLRIATTASRRTGGSLLLGLLSAPLFVIAVVLLLVTVIGIPIAVMLPVAYLIAERAGQLALSYALGCRLMQRRLGEGSFMMPMLAGTSFVATFFMLGIVLGRPEGFLRTAALFFDLLGFLLVTGMSVIGVGAFLLSRAGARPREVEYRAVVGAASHGTAAGSTPPPTPLAPPSTPAV